MRCLFLGVLLCALAAALAVHAQTTTTPEPAQQEATPTTPPETAPQNLPLVNEPPAAEPAADPNQAPAALRSVWEGVTLKRLVQDVKITDLAIALFALVVAFFAWRLATNGGMRAAGDPHTDEIRRMIEVTENAAEAARRSAETAEQTLGILRDTAERQLRAYVTVKQFVQTPQRDRGCLLQVLWQNTGATPTKGFRYWAMLREFDDTIPDYFEFTPAGLKDFAGGELGSNASISSPPLLVPAQTMARMRDAARKVLLLGQAGYADIGGHHARRETRFCVEVVLANGTTSEDSAPFAFVYYPRHNYIT